MQFDQIIILAAHAKNANGKFPDYANGLYLGGQVRMDAAVQICKDNADAPCIVVGGYNDQQGSDIHISKKVDDIVDYLKQKVPDVTIKVIDSLPCTHHNFVAVFNAWKERAKTPKAVGIVTNEYHMPRALAFAQNTAALLLPNTTVHFKPLVAEKILDHKPLDLKYHKQAYARRLKLEHEGLEKIISNTYVDYCLTRDFNHLKTIISEQADRLLTPEENYRLKLD